MIADARDPVGLAEKVQAAGGPADVTVVCVDVAGCEGGAILSTAQGGTVIFFSMATSFSAAALGAEGLAADVRMLVGNGYVPGHADLALGLVRENPRVRALFERRLPAMTGKLDLDPALVAPGPRAGPAGRRARHRAGPHAHHGVGGTGRAAAGRAGRRRLRRDAVGEPARRRGPRGRRARARDRPAGLGCDAGRRLPGPAHAGR